MIRSLKLLAALAAALVLGVFTVSPAFAAARTGGPTPTPATDPGQQVSSLQQQLQQQQATINSLADQEESEQASVKTLESKVSADQQREQKLNQQLNRVARLEYERPALTLTTVMDARNLGELLSGMAQARVISHQQQHLFNAATALKASDQRNQTAAQAQLDKISKQQAQATAIAAHTQAEITTLQAQQQAAQKAAQQQAAQQQAAQQPPAATSQPAAPKQTTTTISTPSVTASASITLQPGPSNPNRFYAGQCTWYVAQIYSIPWMGNANQWPAAAAAAGQAEGQTPVVGAIMESADSSFGHVSVVTSVTDANDWTVTEMNYAGGPGVTDTRHVARASSNLVTFIY